VKSTVFSGPGIELSLLGTLNVKLSFWIYFETIGYIWIGIDTFEKHFETIG
jgi:hypothetical protein